jgi:hypothetical protein
MREPRWEDEAPPEPEGEDRLGWAERIEVASSYTREERRAARATEHARRMVGRRVPTTRATRGRPTPFERRRDDRHRDRMWRRAPLPFGWWRAGALAPLLPAGWTPPRRESAAAHRAAFAARRADVRLGALADVPRGCMFGACRAPAARQHRRTHRWYCPEHWAGRSGAGRAPTTAG